jgi:hypothetical protein
MLAKLMKSTDSQGVDSRNGLRPSAEAMLGYLGDSWLFVKG